MMTKAIIKFLDGGYCNLAADRIDSDDEYVSVFNESTLIGVFCLERLEAIYISEAKEK